MGNKYLKSYTRFVKNSLAVDMEYRAGFLFKNITGLVWVIGALFLINVIFSQSSSVAGWTKQQVTCLYLTFSIAVDAFYIFVRDNLRKFLNLIRDGQLDAYLLKPINLRFLVTFMSNQMGYYVLFRFFAAIILLIVYSPTSNIFNWSLYISFTIIGSIGVYSAVFILHTLNFWLIRLENITELSNQSYELAKVPIDAWPKQIQLFLTYAFPITVLSSFAVNALFGKAGVIQLLLSVIVSTILYFISDKFWNFALRHYSSASS